MGTRTLSVDDRAYELLTAAKRPGESYSQVIHRVLGRQQPSLLAFSRLLSPPAARALERSIRARRRAEAAAKKGRARRWS